MATRVLVTLTEPTCDPDAAVLKALRDLGAEPVRPPSPELPGVVIAEVADEQVDEFVRRAGGLAQVSVAEPDRMRSTFMGEPPAAAAPPSGAMLDETP